MQALAERRRRTDGQALPEDRDGCFPYAFDIAFGSTLVAIIIGGAKRPD